MIKTACACIDEWTNKQMNEWTNEKNGTLVFLFYSRYEVHCSRDDFYLSEIKIKVEIWTYILEREGY